MATMLDICRPPSPFPFFPSWFTCMGWLGSLSRAVDNSACWWYCHAPDIPLAPFLSGLFRARNLHV